MKNPPYIWHGRGKSRKREHRAVMERILNRTLQPNEVVHHRNGDVTDNRPENLELLTRAEHTSLHMRGRKVAWRPLPEAQRAKIAAALKGRCTPPETRMRLSTALKGRTLTDEHRANISKAMRRKRIEAQG